MNADLRRKAKAGLEKDFFELMNNAVFGETIENMGKHRDIRLATTEKRRNYLVSEPNYCTYYKVFHRKFISNRSEKNNGNTYE